MATAIPRAHSVSDPVLATLHNPVEGPLHPLQKLLEGCVMSASHLCPEAGPARNVNYTSSPGPGGWSQAQGALQCKGDMSNKCRMLVPPWMALAQDQTHSRHWLMQKTGKWWQGSTGGLEKPAEAHFRDTSPNKIRTWGLRHTEPWCQDRSHLWAESGPVVRSRPLPLGLISSQRSHTDLVPVAKLQPLPDEQSSGQELPVPQGPLLPFLQARRNKSTKC